MGKDTKDVNMEGEEMEDDQTDGNELQCDFSAYVLFHEGSTGSPCLSFDILRDSNGDNRNCDTPVSLTFVSGSQAEKNHLNQIVVLKMKNLKKIDHDEDSEGENSDSEEEDSVTITSATARHNGCVNRIRATKYNDVPLAASWSETGHVNVWDLSSMLRAVDSETAKNEFEKEPPVVPLYTFEGHHQEGYAVDWSQTMPGYMATGDCGGVIHIWKPSEGLNSWSINRQSLLGHTASIEDLQWSPNEPNVLASCSVDKSIRIWDIRVNPEKACMITCENAHTSDVNVIHWNCNEPFIASGGDDASIFIWDLRKLKSGTSVAQLKNHTGPITSVEWHHSDSSVLASGGEDNQILQWDLAVEKDDQEKQQNEQQDIPDQLLFIHRGQKEVKELHWHPQVPGLMITTALSGFNVFKTISC